MRKKLIMPTERTEDLSQNDWLDLETLAQIELTSEDALHPIEAAFRPEIETGWKAVTPGKQTIRLLFDHPQDINCISLQFREEEYARTQELLLRYSSDRENSYQEIVRQQYNFSPPATCHQNERYIVKLEGVTALELIITPDISGGNAYATLAGFQLT